VTHKREQIRAAIVAALGQQATLTGKVFAMRVRRTSDEELPVVLVYPTREASELADMKRTLSRALTVAIEIRDKTTSTGDIGAGIDDLAVAVEAAMIADPSFGRLALNSYLAATTIELDGEGDFRQAVAVLEYQVTYRTPGA